MLTEIQCKSKRLRKNTKASSDESTGDDVVDSRDGKQVVSTTKPSKVRTQALSDWVIQSRKLPLLKTQKYCHFKYLRYSLLDAMLVTV